VIAAAQLGERPFVIGHSFGGFMTMKVASQYGDMLGGVIAATWSRSAIRCCRSE